MTLVLHEHPFAAYCWKVLIAFYDRDVPFERVNIGSDEDRARLTELWPTGNIPVLVDDGLVLGEASVIVEHVTPDLVTGLDVRLWDRLVESQVMTPMQKIVADSLRPENARDAYGVHEARATLDRAYSILEAQLTGNWLVGATFTLADCCAAPALHYANAVHRWNPASYTRLTAYHERLETRPSIKRVIDEARFFREFFPLGWPDHVK